MNNSNTPKYAPIQLRFFDKKYALIPWEVHLKIYEAYCRRYGSILSAEAIAQRGGFEIGEAASLCPKWNHRFYGTNDLSDESSFTEYRYEILCNATQRE